MLRIYPVLLELVVRLRPMIGIIERKDRDLGRQLRRCTASACLNLGEGMYSRGKNRAAKYHVALGSAREMLSCLEVAVAFGYVAPLERTLVGDFNQVIGSLVRLVERAA